jgi:hypothetical protein
MISIFVNFIRVVYLLLAEALFQAGVLDESAAAISMGRGRGGGGPGGRTPYTSGGPGRDGWAGGRTPTVHQTK